MSKPDVKRMIQQRDDAAKILGRLNDSTLFLFYKRARFAPSVTQGEGGNPHDVSRPTELAAINHIEGRRIDDPQGEAFCIIQTELGAMAKSSTRINNALSLVYHISDGKKHRESSLSTCQACQRDDVTNTPNDRIRSGYCEACYSAWRRWDGDRHSFEVSKRGEG